MICIARIFGAPLTVPTGSETRRASNAVIFSRTRRFTIRAVYSGDAHFVASSQSLTEQVNP